jgi:hypothetical protein
MDVANQAVTTTFQFQVFVYLDSSRRFDYRATYSSISGAPNRIKLDLIGYI